MYENGKRIQGYQKKRLHKRRMRNGYAKAYGKDNWKVLMIDAPFHCYWKEPNISGLYSYAKGRTNDILRNNFKNLSRKALLVLDFDEEELYGNLTKGKYRKYY